jgi:hypothetical protein
MPEIFRRLRRLALVVAVAAAGALGGPQAAHAGDYTVSGTCGLWSPWNYDASKIAVYCEGPTLVARQSWGNYTTAAGVGGGWQFTAPAGTSIQSVSLSGSLRASSGWQAEAYTEGFDARSLIGCPGLSCPGGANSFTTYPTYNAPTVTLRVRCGASSCSNNADTSNLSVTSASFDLYDFSPPSAALAGGSLISGGWKNGTASVVIAGSDNAGIQETRAVIDGAVVKIARSNCAWGQLVPCPNGNVSLDVPTTNLADGAHSVSGQVVDAAGNVMTSPATTFYVDNTAPAAADGVQLEGSPGWRATNSFDLNWKNPPQTQAPIAAAVYRLCPAVDANANASDKAAAQQKCVQGTSSGQNIDEIKGVKVPAAGSWDAQVWLVDGAGNQQPNTASPPQELQFDDTPPSSPTFLAPDPQNPAQIHVQTDDQVSGIVSGSIEVRRDGQSSWQPLATQVDADGLTAFMDDEALVKGTYFLRATAVDGSGLEVSNDRDAQAQPAELKLPIRLASHLTVGKPGKEVCHGHGKSRSCARRLAAKPNVSVGKSTRLSGRLLVSGKPMPGTSVEVWRRLDLDGAQWAQIGTVTSSKTGRFSYLAPRGPAREIRFRYAGTNLIRGRNGDVTLRVRAGTTLHPSKHNAVNGDDVTFRGTLKGGWVPGSGVLVELQVYSRNGWRTFAQPRAAAGTGKWSYRYRFETVSGHAKFRFRARVRQQPDYPFTTGASAATRISVRGL